MKNVRKIHLPIHFKDLLLMTVGVIMAGFALESFLVPNKFFDGGVSGISLLIHEIYHVPLPVVLVIANLPFIVMSSYVINKEFAVKMFVCVVLLGVCFAYFPYPKVIVDKPLVSVFGGFFLGVGIGLTIRAGSVLDGIEVLGMYTGKRSSFSVTEIVFAINVIIFLIAALKFGIQTSLYSMLTYFTASKTVDYVVEGIEEYTGVTIISSRSEIVKDKLVNELGRGITVYKGERGYLPGNFEVHNDTDIIFTVITRLEMRKLKNLLHDIDPNAFIFANTIKEASGGILRRRSRH
ncbi:YitT family protein [Ilyomonas limi]|uniref:YitT family protein n=1 Tax=Ilyomonas limi TaxID=2575867 RepID=A0A4U3KZV9_9BACT|nr:YitT family protein [Ilyomonas limi]TKK67439.1 YitT family protein [Ilyomonas limi]